jgi:hypothetical protein
MSTRSGVTQAVGRMAIAACVCLLASCAGSSQSAQTGRQVTATEFAAPGAPAVAGERVPTVPGAQTTIPTSPQGMTDVVVVMGAPINPLAAQSDSSTKPPEAGASGPAGAASAAAAAPTAPTRPDERLLVDQLVGQINGRPVFANEFFAPMDARMRQMAREMDDRQWLVQARKEIDAALWDKLRDQLLLAEFESSLTPEQKIGLFAYMESIRADLVSGNLGSEAQANQRLQQTEQTDLDTKVADLSRQTFIREQLRKSIAARVQVSYWDVRLFYDQHADEFLPPPIAKFVVIQAPLTDTERVARIESALQAGEEFRLIAARESTWRPNAGNGLEITIKSRQYAKERYFGPEPLNAAVVQLDPGGVTNRIEFAGDAWWIMLAEIDQPPGRTLYEVQSEIERRLRAERWREEEVRYFDQLFQRGSFSDVKQMSIRLLEFGALRYLVQDRMAVPQLPPDSAVPVPMAPEQPGATAPEPAAGAR